MSIFCYNCNTELDFTENDKISRREECPSCGEGIYCCAMCQFHDSTAYNECREPMANRVAEKTKVNFCTYFRLAAGRPSNKPDKDDLVKLADSLFKK